MKPERNRTPAIIIGSLIVFLLIIGVIAKKDKKAKKAEPGTRAVLVSTADRARTVVVPPCGTGEQITTRSAEGQLRTLGATAVGLAKGRGVRAVLVPSCPATNAAPSTPSASLPSAAFVLKIGAGVTASNTAKPGAAKSTLAPQEIIVPAGSRARTIVVPPCAKKQEPKGSRQVVLAPKGSSSTALAPAC